MKKMQKSELERVFPEIDKAAYVVAPRLINNNKLKKQMRSLIRMAKEVIDEIEKENPDNILISDIAVEEMGELIEEISSTVLGVIYFD